MIANAGRHKHTTAYTSLIPTLICICAIFRQGRKHLKRSLTAASLAPMYLFSTCGPFTLTRRMPAAATAAATMCVLLQPGGPYSSTPVRSLNGALSQALL